MAPIAALTSTAAEIARTRDPSRKMPASEADDEVAELASTLESMLRELDAAREETEETLRRQRRFVADASHELRTPLTSVLANLELLAESLEGEQGEAARSALRSSQRMRRLVADLLLLARTDAAHVPTREPVDLGRVVVEAAGELGPVTVDHDISLDIRPAPTEASRDELHRLVINLLENALRHTPPGTEIHVHEDPARWPRRDDRRRQRPGHPVGTGADVVRALRPRCRGPRWLVRPGPCDRPRRRHLSRRNRHACPAGEPGGGRRAPASSCACRPSQTSTTTGSTIGRRLRRS